MVEAHRFGPEGGDLIELQIVLRDLHAECRLDGRGALKNTRMSEAACFK
jgi:hypothetical protein